MASTKKKADKAFELFQQLQTLNADTTTINLLKGKILIELQEKNLYKQLMGDDKASFKEFLAWPEVSIPSSTAYLYIAVYRKFIEELKIPEKRLRNIDLRKLDMVCSYINESNTEEMLAKAEKLTREELQRELKFGDVSPMSCKHEWISKTKKVCKKCGETINVK